MDTVDTPKKEMQYMSVAELTKELIKIIETVALHPKDKTTVLNEELKIRNIKLRIPWHRRQDVIDNIDRVVRYIENNDIHSSMIEESDESLTDVSDNSCPTCDSDSD